ncbi:tetratricopeptide repeat protein [Paracoccus litorisediminis]|uniref:TolB amino-terminal domain-containing protein n=1 Tax=Paracoccus litorisediminis TaxID=2006130 RepID=A0A844HR79_9RHOB|nr:hypothetical protein [Paracoccus litorisediminis]MTH61659.1 hypothetical protein [Paracoccus litorisediminis]
MSDGLSSSIPEPEIRAELERILASSDFQASARNRRFLRHVVEETLLGRGGRIKAYSIATSVFGRPDDFDPLQDSIVRIEAARLRRAIERFYLLEGDRLGARITIPKGTYVPEFSRPQSPAEASPLIEQKAPPATEPLQDYGPRILVELFEQEGDLASCPTIGRTLTRQVISALTRFTDLFVYGPATAEVGGAEHDLPIDYRLSGTLTLSRDRLHADLLMSRQMDGRYVWAQTLDHPLGVERDPQQIVSLCSEIAGHVVRVVALRDGILDSQARESGGAAPRHFAGYQKLLDFHDYWRTLDPARFEPLRLDLEATIAADSGFAAGRACLSLLYGNAARFGYQAGPAPLDRALSLAREAIRLAPNSSKAYHARAVAEWFLGQPESALATLQMARALNPNDPELMAELGFRHAKRMVWEIAVPLLEEAYLRNPLQSGQYRMGLFFFHFAHDRPAEALREALAINAPGIGHFHLASCAALSEMGRIDEARAYLAETDRLVPGLRDRLVEDLTFRQIHPDLIAAIARAIGRVDPGPGRVRHLRRPPAS